MVDAFVRDGGAPDITSATLVPAKPGLLMPIPTPADDVRELEARKRQLQEEIEQLERRKQQEQERVSQQQQQQQHTVSPDGASAAEATDGQDLSPDGTSAAEATEATDGQDLPAET